MSAVFRVKYRAFGVITSEVLRLEAKANHAHTANFANNHAYTSNNAHKANIANNANTTNHANNNTNKTNKTHLSHQLALQLNIKPAQIIKINKEYGQPRCDIKPQDLSSVLMSLYAAALNGEHLTDTLTDTLKDFYKNSALNNKLFVLKKQSVSISQALQRLQVNPIVVALVETGVSTGKLPLALDKAQGYLELIEQMKQKSKTGFSAAVFKLVFGGLLTFGAPIFLATFFNDILGQLNKESGFVIHLFNVIKENNPYFLIMALSVVAVVVYLLKFKQQQTSHWPVFSIFFEIKALKKALAFIPFYSTLNESGVNDKDIISKYQQIDAIVARQLLSSINKGLSIVEAIKASSIDTKTAKYLASALGIEHTQAREKAFMGTLKRLTARLDRQHKKLNVIFTSMATLMILTGISMLIGAYFVMSTIAF